MFDYFWKYQNELPDGVGYAQFDVTHLSILAVLIIAGAVYLWTYIKAAPNMRKKISLVTAWVLFLLLPVRMTYAVIKNIPIIYELPLHLCSMTGILVLIHRLTLYRFGWMKWLGKVLYTFCLPGAALAVIFPDGTIYPPVSFISIESYLFHFLIIVYIVSSIINKEIIPGMKGWYVNILFLAATVPGVYLFDIKYNANYMFLLSPVKGSPLEWCMKLLGHDLYLVGYAAIAVIVVLLMNIPFDICTKISKSAE